METTYIVTIIVLLDHPELRGPGSFARLPAGSILRDEVRTTSHRSAVALYDGVMAGEYDFGAEYATRVGVLGRRLDRETGRVVTRTVRRRVRRADRGGEWVAEG